MLSTMSSCSDSDTVLTNTNVIQTYQHGLKYAAYGFLLNLGVIAFAGLHAMFLVCWSCSDKQDLSGDTGSRQYVHQVDEKDKMGPKMGPQ